MGWKKLSLCHKIWFSNFYIFATQCRRPLIFQTINSATAYNLSLKYLRFTPSGSIDIGIGKFEFVAKTQFLCCGHPCVAWGCHNYFKNLKIIFSHKQRRAFQLVINKKNFNHLKKKTRNIPLYRHSAYMS